MLWLLPAWSTDPDAVLYPLSVVYHSAARCITGLLPSMHISNLLTCAYLPLLETYLDYLSSRYAIRLLFRPAGHTLCGLPMIPHCPNLAPGTTYMHSLINPLLVGTLENRSTPHIDFSITNLPSPNLNKYDQPTLRHISWASSLPNNTILWYTDSSKIENGHMGYGATTYCINYGTP
jgi:hypothetical protein